MDHLKAVKSRLAECGICQIANDPNHKVVRTLSSRRLPLCAPEAQLEAIRCIAVPSAPNGCAEFDCFVSSAGTAVLCPVEPEVLQINLGKLCNMTCRHCHVDAGPERVDETMTRETADACLELAQDSHIHTVDLTGGAPELNPNFEYIIERASALGKHVIDRCNLTVLLLPRFSDLPSFFAQHHVEVFCSLPHWRIRNTDNLRGEGTFLKSIAAMKLLNAAGYGQGDPDRVLTVMSNPAGAFLAPDQCAAEKEWKKALLREEGVRFDRLIALNNMPIGRFLEWLINSGNLADYFARLVAGFNPATIERLMCRNTISVSWDGRVFDCDFNQMLEMEAQYNDGLAVGIQNLDLGTFKQRRIRTARHCFGCTAGAGSSCGGATAD